MTIKLICAWCQLVLQEGYEPPSHGICPECQRRVFKETDQRAERSAKCKELNAKDVIAD